MQVLKDEIKEKIYTAAIAEFREKGFLQSSMRNIAKASGMTAGNIYRYYKNKEELYYAIVDPVYYKVVKIVDDGKQLCMGSIDTFLQVLVESILELIMKHHDELLILIDGSEGTIYHNIQEQVIEMIKAYKFATLKETFTNKANVVEVDKLVRFSLEMASGTLIEGIVKILRSFSSEEDIRFMLIWVIKFCFNDISNRFK